ncbi:MAG TPA: hypothetical protein DCY35_07540 [Prolixibacteraceae bacterium]|nr:hypothetical protein [Prolixibacteraceae bacterium]
MVEKFKHVLVTGAAGFIGFHLSARLLRHGCRVTGIDNLTPYYDVELKKARLEQLLGNPAFSFERVDLADRRDLEDFFDGNGFDAVVNLAAQAGVRYSLEVPEAYVNSNLVGFANILECCRHHQIRHLVFASSSSVYGANTMMPFSVHHNVDHPVSLYAATKKSNELMAHTYSHLFRLPCTGLRFFTVYGPWGRPDMALFIFTRAILDGKPIKVYNHGKMRRDFTYIDDIIEGVVRVIDKVPVGLPPVKVYNIGHSDPVRLDRFIGAIETALGKEALKEYFPMQPGDVYKTYADVTALENDLEYHPSTSIETGIQKFVAWYRAYYHSS